MHMNILVCLNITYILLVLSVLSTLSRRDLFRLCSVRWRPDKCPSIQEIILVAQSVCTEIKQWLVLRMLFSLMVLARKFLFPLKTFPIHFQLEIFLQCVCRKSFSRPSSGLYQVMDLLGLCSSGRYRRFQPISSDLVFFHFQHISNLMSPFSAHLQLMAKCLGHCCL